MNKAPLKHRRDECSESENAIFLLLYVIKNYSLRYNILACSFRDWHSSKISMFIMTWNIIVHLAVIYFLSTIVNNFFICKLKFCSNLKLTIILYKLVVKDRGIARKLFTIFDYLWQNRIIVRETWTEFRSLRKFHLNEHFYLNLFAKHRGKSI